jgi:GNAT superfamily N-acetyltransferase
MSAAAARVVGGAELRSIVPALAEVLADCVNGGASVSFMAPYSLDAALAYWQRIAGSVDDGTVSVLVGELDGRVVGTVQLSYDVPPNQRHRAEIRKLLVHPRARRRGIGAMLMAEAERVAAARGRSLLVLDTASGAAERLYKRGGWIRVGVIPDYALWPTGGFCDTTIFYKRIA